MATEGEQAPKTYTEDDVKAARAEGRASALKSLGFDSMTAAETALTALRTAAESAAKIPEFEKQIGSARERMKRIAERDLAGLTEQQRAAVLKRAADPEAQLEYLDGLREGGFLPAAGAAPGGTAAPVGDATTAAAAAAAASAPPPPAATTAGAPPPPPAAGKPATHATRYDELSKSDPIGAGLYWQTWGPVIERERAGTSQN